MASEATIRSTSVVSVLVNCLTFILVAAGCYGGLYAWYIYHNLGGAYGAIIAAIVIWFNTTQIENGQSWYKTWCGWLWGTVVFVISSCIFIPNTYSPEGQTERKWVMNETQVGYYQIGIPFLTKIQAVHLQHAYTKGHAIPVYGTTQDGVQVRGEVSLSADGPLSDDVIRSLSRNDNRYDLDEKLDAALASEVNEQFKAHIANTNSAQLQNNLRLEFVAGEGARKVMQDFDLSWGENRTIEINNIHPYFGH